jgi:hypothetical protein
MAIVAEPFFSPAAGQRPKGLAFRHEQTEHEGPAWVALYGGARARH